METVVSFLLEELSTYIRQESSLLGGLGDEVQALKDELEQMKDFLRRADAMMMQNNNNQDDPSLAAGWVRQIRDVAYDVEDVLDEFLLRCASDLPGGWFGRVRKICDSFKKLRARHQVASGIQNIRQRIRNVSEAHQRFQHRNGNSQSGSSRIANNRGSGWYDARGDALLQRADDLVGIERPKEEVVRNLLSSDSKLNVIAVTGMGGSGKTTLMKMIFDDAAVRSQFNCHVWLSVSENLRIEVLLRAAMRQVLKFDDPGLEAMNDVDDLKSLVYENLRPKTYMVFLDDLWHINDWEAIRMVFPKDSRGSRVVLTSRNREVAQAATSEIGGFVYQLQPLTEAESWTLFCKKVFRATSCPPHLENLSMKILRGCQGLPLAIVVIASVLATKPRRTEEWDLFRRSLHVVNHNTKLENMKKLLSLSYYDLPDHLRICLSYLSIFPEDDFIQKTHLIRLWIAEGFVQEKEGMTMEEVAEVYLNELINRSLVQVARTDIDGRLMACRIHDIIWQIIIELAREQNLTTIFGEGSSATLIHHKVRRLAVHSNYVELAEGLDFKCLRSWVAFSIHSGSLSEAYLIKVLRNGRGLVKVLELRGAPLETIPEEIFKLFNLKYLSLRNTKVRTVPKLIKRLQRLETLDLKGTQVRELPAEILKLQKLRHLIVCRHKPFVKGYRTFNSVQSFKAPYEIGCLVKLQTLTSIEADQVTGSRISILKEIGKLTQLRRLRIAKVRSEDERELCSSLKKLINLRSLKVITINEEEVIDLPLSPSLAPRFLRTLELRGGLKKLPIWVSNLHGLTKVFLRWSRLHNEPLHVLQDLPNLIELLLECAFEGEELRFIAGGFQMIKRLRLIKLQQLKWVKVEDGAMPCIEDLRIINCKSMEILPTGIEYLRKLQYLEVFDMSDRFEEAFRSLDRQSADYQKIARVPRVHPARWEDDGWKSYDLMPSG